MTDISFHK